MFENVSTGKQWDASVKDISGDILCVSQFTLYAKTSKGSKPDFHQAMKSTESMAMYHSFLAKMKTAYDADKIKDGIFGETMKVDIVNEGPVTIILDTEQK
ncbi:D-tyrosyl-tRNA(Tyr) deacylase [Batrachochytrium salamandrivorans]|nr:D-tyrosyl-tRNA(Tyr) deacylase [Batrachochytrium salamandrivorans]